MFKRIDQKNKELNAANVFLRFFSSSSFLNVLGSLVFCLEENKGVTKKNSQYLRKSVNKSAYCKSVFHL